MWGILWTVVTAALVLLGVLLALALIPGGALAVVLVVFLLVLLALGRGMTRSGL